MLVKITCVNGADDRKQGRPRLVTLRTPGRDIGRSTWSAIEYRHNIQNQLSEKAVNQNYHLVSAYLANHMNLELWVRRFFAVVFLKKVSSVLILLNLKAC